MLPPLALLPSAENGEEVPTLWHGDTEGRGLQQDVVWRLRRLLVLVRSCSCCWVEPVCFVLACALSGRSHAVPLVRRWRCSCHITEPLECCYTLWPRRRCGKEIDGYRHFRTGECILFDEAEVLRCAGRMGGQALWQAA